MSTLLEVIISLAFIYLVFSVLVSGCCELWQLIIRKRSLFMYDAMSQVFNDRLNKDYTHMLYSHPLVDQLKERNDTYPHYIGANAFADALIDVIRNDGKLPKILFDHEKKSFIPQPVAYSTVPDSDGVERGGGIVADFRASVEAMQESDLRQLLRTMSFGVNTYPELKQNIVNWFNSYMNATSTWYKRDITKILMTFGVIVTLIFNIDSISLVKELYRNKLFREKIVNEAINYTNTHTPEVKTDSETVALILRGAADDIDLQKKSDSIWKAEVKRNVDRIKAGYDEQKMLDLPIGWGIPDEAKGNVWWKNVLYFLWWIVKSIPGWIITSFALSYGADNWFNLLLKLINFRTSVKPKE